MAELFLGLDLGGTSIKAGITDGQGRLIAQSKTPTVADPEQCIKDMIDAAKKVAASADIPLARIKAVGILAPGQASLKDGIVHRSANLPRWKEVHIRAKITKGLGIPGVLENDANAAAYGEYWAGAGKGRSCKNLVMFTFGTGVGGGIVLDGHVFRGEHDIAAELGHMIIEPKGDICGCGQRGCLEVYTSAKYTAQRAADLLRLSSEPSTLRPLTRGGNKIECDDVVEHAKRGDALAKQVWADTCFYIALACINTVHWLDPDIILLGGGMSNAGGFLLNPVEKFYKRNFWKTVKSQVIIRIASLGNDAGMIGAAGVAKDALRSKTAVIG